MWPDVSRSFDIFTQGTAPQSPSDAKDAFVISVRFLRADGYFEKQCCSEAIAG